MFTKEEIAAKALQIVRENGVEALSARSLGAALGCSSRPIFTVFRSMEEVEAEVRTAARKMFAAYVDDVTDYMPAFKEFGMRLVRFACEEKNLFHYLFLHKEAVSEGIHPKAVECLESICTDYGISKEQAEKLFLQMWIYTCGLALMCNKEKEAYTEQVVSELISMQFVSTLTFIRSGRQLPDITPHLRREGEKRTLDID